MLGFPPLSTRIYISLQFIVLRRFFETFLHISQLFAMFFRHFRKGLSFFVMLLSSSEGFSPLRAWYGGGGHGLEKFLGFCRGSNAAA